LAKKVLLTIVEKVDKKGLREESAEKRLLKEETIYY